VTQRPKNSKLADLKEAIARTEEAIFAAEQAGNGRRLKAMKMVLAALKKKVKASK
jgi:hypothetical protein